MGAHELLSKRYGPPRQRFRAASHFAKPTKPGVISPGGDGSSVVTSAVEGEELGSS
jgi:hypothetical protein